MVRNESCKFKNRHCGEENNARPYHGSKGMFNYTPFTGDAGIQKHYEKICQSQYPLKGHKKIQNRYGCKISKNTGHFVKDSGSPRILWLTIPANKMKPNYGCRSICNQFDHHPMFKRLL